MLQALLIAVKNLCTLTDAYYDANPGLRESMPENTQAVKCWDELFAAVSTAEAEFEKRYSSSNELFEKIKNELYLNEVYISSFGNKSAEVLTLLTELHHLSAKDYTLETFQILKEVKYTLSVDKATLPYFEINGNIICKKQIIGIGPLMEETSDNSIESSVYNATRYIFNIYLTNGCIEIKSEWYRLGFRDTNNAEILAARDKFKLYKDNYEIFRQAVIELLNS